MDANGFVTSFEYDANGNRIKRTDAYNRVTKYGYDELNRLASITDAKGKLTTLGYDANDHLVSVKDPEGFTTTYVYDGLDNLRQLISPDTGTTSYTPDAAGRTASKTDARNKTATYGYDNLGRIKTIAYGDQTHTFSYDTAPNGIGRLGSFSDADGSTSYSYDTLGHITQVSRTATVSGASLIQKVGYGWGNNNTLTSITYPSGATISYVWTNGAISAVQVNGKNLISNIAWSNSIGAQSWTWGNGQLWGRAADLTGRIAGATSGDTIVTHGYDNVGNISSITDTSHDSLSQAYGYDELGRLTQGTTVGVTRNYSYDDNGSRTNENHGASNTDYHHDANSNKLLNTTGSNANSYSYDASGNRANDAGMVNTYNNAGRLTQLQRGTAITQYSYNALGQRLQKSNSNGTFRYVYDEAGHLLGEYQANGSAIQETIWLGDTPIAVIKPSADPQNPATYYVWADHLGTPRQITDSTNNQLVWRWDSEAFGDTLPNQDPSNTGSTFAYNLRFPGQYYDQESGHFYNYFRDYDPATGRYVESDPIGLAGGSYSTYGYVGGNPLAHKDPSGRCIEDACIGEGLLATAIATEAPAIEAEIPVIESEVAAVATEAQAFFGRAAQTAEYYIYQGYKNGQAVYTGITNDIARRATEWGDKFKIEALNSACPVTRDQARAVEQVLIEKNPDFLNKINSIAPTRLWYPQAITWGQNWLKSNGLIK
jgi:RHS repeat-associated protein